MKRYPAWVISGLILFMAGTGVQAADLEMFGASSRASAMGSAMTAIADGSEAIFYNPSALALSRNTVSLEWTLRWSHLDVNGRNYGPGDTGLNYMPNLIGINGRFLRERIGAGIMVNGGGLGGLTGGGGGGGGEGLGLITNGYGWPMYGSPTIPLYYGLGFRLHDKLSVGFIQSTNIWLTKFSDLTLNLDDVLELFLGLSTGIPVPNINPHWYVAIAMEPGDVGWSVTFRPVKYLSLGYVQRPGSWVRYKIPVIIASESLLDDDLRLYILGDFWNTPDKEQWGAAVHLPLPKSKLTLSYTQDQQFWHRMHEETLKQYLRWTQPEVAGLIQLTGGGPTADWDNVSLDRYGMEYVLEAGWLPTKFLKERNPKIALRGGYFHWDSPLSDQKMGDDFDSDADVYSGGLGFNLDRKGRKHLKDPSTRRQFSVDVHFQYFDIEERDYKLEYNEWGSVRGSSSVYYYHTEGEILNTGIQLTWWY